MSERRTDKISRELRATAPPAPYALRERVREIAAGEQVRTPRLFPRRRALALAAAATLVLLTLGAAVVPRLTEERDRTAVEAPQSRERAQRGELFRSTTTTAAEADALRAPGAASTLPPGRRPQDYRAAITLRVDDADELSGAAQQAMRDTRRMGGFVASVDFATEREGGDATLVLRVPVARVQDAIGRFSDLGTIVAQRVAIDDLRPQADRLATSIARLRKRIAELEAKQRRTGLTPTEQYQLETARQQLRTSTQRRAAVVRQATYATVALKLTTERSAQKEEPGAFGAFWDDASTILLTELIWLLYALVVAGPFLLLALLALLAERARRRRANDALLAHH
jgi:hypothetical protein